MKVSRTVRSGEKVESRVSPLLRPYLSLFIIVAKKTGITANRLKDMVCEINNTQVLKEDLLSYNIYQYEAKTDRFSQISGNDKKKFKKRCFGIPQLTLQSRRSSNE